MAKSLQSRPISAGSSGRRRGCRAAGLPACYRYRASAPAFPDRRPQADIIRRWISRVDRPAAHCFGRSSCPAGRCCPAVSIALARNRPGLWAKAARSGPVASPASAGPVRMPHRMPQIARMRSGVGVSSACRENGWRARMFPRNPSGFAVADQ
jgi:hypothetical protein